ncbi:PREDICTED: semaphorin-7A [Nanorana parkeri]|uniref:semaphorin-7A n=1 Tax=Nanorana parkeri TaxID=125878 RepID=UPI000854191F|nr:PREDICTED: semaphorin-7A [Nanorana parkeri]
MNWRTGSISMNGWLRLSGAEQPETTVMQAFCKNFVTFVARLDGYLLVCGTNAYNPACWKMDGGTFEKQSTSWAEQLSPRFPGFNYNILNIGNEMYSTIPKQSNNAASTKKATFKKIKGTNPMRYTGGNLLKNPVFVKSLAVEAKQKNESRIFLFFMDDNSELRTTDKRVPMIAQMCKEEMGSVKPDERNMFSTALKSRLICGDPEGQYYNILQDIYFLQSQDLVYGLFTNAWNHSAVCSYKIENIESVFNTSDLFGSEKKDLEIRPGKCLSEHTPQVTADEAANHPELVDWVWPLGNRTVFQTLEYYRKLVVDEIAAKNEIWRVIIVATDSGRLHKVVVDHVNNSATNVLEMQPCNKTVNILFLQLDQNNTEHTLYVGTANAIYRIFLDDCRAYNNSCTDCRSSEDPYCAWYGGECQSILKRPLENLKTGASAGDTVCAGIVVFCNDRHRCIPDPFNILLERHRAFHVWGGSVLPAYRSLAGGRDTLGGQVTTYVTRCRVRRSVRENARRSPPPPDEAPIGAKRVEYFVTTH